MPADGAYVLHDYVRMMADDVRREAHAEALRRVIGPHSVVLDLGAGPGFSSLLALQAGAAHVHAVDTNALVLRAPELAREAGFAGRVTAHHLDAHALCLPAPVDVLMADLRGTLPWFGSGIAALTAVARRWLRPGGTLMPRRDRLRAALVVVPRWQAELQRSIAACPGITAAMQRELRSGYTRYDDEVELLHAPWEAACLEYGEPPAPFHRAEVCVQANRTTEAHAVLVWFDADLVEGVSYSSGPGGATAYGRALFPLDAPLAVQAGGTVRIESYFTPTADAVMAAFRIQFAEQRREAGNWSALGSRSPRR